MRVFTYHERPGASALTDEPVLIREGFSWPAALFSAFWALWHGLWLVAGALFALGLAVEAGLVFFGADPLAKAAVSIGLAAIIGFCANDWRRARLRKQGYQLMGIVAADSIDSARRRWFDLRLPGRAASDLSA